jgi:uncharacterized membrane protein
VDHLSGLVDYSILATALGCGLVAGVFFGFSSFIMGALRRLPPAHGIAAMQSINIVVINPLFMAALFGTGAACLGLAVWGVASTDDARAGWAVAGAALYLVGTVGVTMAANVPRNDRLEKLDPDDPEAASVWDDYVREWTFWNSVRTAAALAGAALLTVGLTEG